VLQGSNQRDSEQFGSGSLARFDNISWVKGGCPETNTGRGGGYHEQG
jgi:hypothetical protein